MENTEVVSQTVFESSLNKMQNLIDSFGQIQTAWGLVVAIVLMLAFIFAILSFRNSVNKSTKSQIQFFIKVKKYEPSLYIELNQNMENLRFFLFGNKWKKRIVQKYNKIFRGYEGEKLKKTFKNDYSYKISIFTKNSKIRKHLNSFICLFEAIRSERKSYIEKLGEYFFIVRNLAYDYSKIIEDIHQYLDMITQKSILIVGSAGNGKTNLMCRISEIAIGNKIPVMLINSRDIDAECKDYILNKLPVPNKLKWLSNIYLHIISFLLLLQKKNFYIIIDAINENDREVFINSIGKMVDYFSRYKRIRIALTCRSEYFESRYKNYFEECEHPPHIFDIMADRYDNRASLKMLKTYRKYFNVQGKISYHAQKRLFKSLFLMRVFFEVNSNHDEGVMELRNAEVYLSYLERINDEIKTINFIDIVNKVAKVMIENSEYNHVTLESLNISNDDRIKLFQVLDDNLIMSRTILTGQGITKNKDEVVAFTFDEFRDFCLARYLLRYSEGVRDSEYTLFFSKASEMFTNRQSPVEGVIKYAYYYFKSTGYIELSKKILDLYSASDIQNIADRDYRKERQRSFHNFGLSLIFIDGGEIIESEILFLKEYIKKDSSKYWNVFWFLLANEYSNVSPRLDLGMKLLIEDKSFDEIFNIVNFFFADRHDYRYRGSDDKRKVSILCDWIEQIKKLNGSLSIELKQFLLVLFAIDTHEFDLRRYSKYVLEEPVYTSLCDSTHCTELKECLQELRKSIEQNSGRKDVLHELLQFLIQGGEPDDN